MKCYIKKKTDISLAPNSKMDFPVTLDGDIMRAGEYTSHVVLKGDDKEWKWDEDFTITDEEADRFNKQDPYLVQEGTGLEDYWYHCNLCSCISNCFSNHIQIS